MLGTEDTVIGEEGNAAGRAYYETHTGPRRAPAAPRPWPHARPFASGPWPLASRAAAGGRGRRATRHAHTRTRTRRAARATHPHPCRAARPASLTPLASWARRQLLEIKRGGHVSFTSCELYNPEYGNGIGESKSLSRPGETYTPLPIAQQHEVINAYALAFLNAHLRPDVDGSELGGFGAAFLEQNHFDAEEVIWK